MDIDDDTGCAPLPWALSTVLIWYRLEEGYYFYLYNCFRILIEGMTEKFFLFLLLNFVFSDLFKLMHSFSIEGGNLQVLNFICFKPCVPKKVNKPRELACKNYFLHDVDFHQVLRRDVSDTAMQLWWNQYSMRLFKWHLTISKMVLLICCGII